MQRVKRSTAVPALPAPPAGGTPGYFTGGDPQTAVPATVPGYEWFNGIQEEFAYVIEQAGLVMSSADNTQLRAAILKMIQDAGKAVVIQNATFEASVANGEAVRWDAGNNRFDEAIADGSANNQAVGFADVTNSKVYCYGETPALFAGLTPGARYYLDAATPGAITTAAPADKVPVGIAKSATTLFVDIDQSVGLADPMTTRGDIVVRGASGTTRLALGALGKRLKSDGTDAVWGGHGAWETKAPDTVYQAATDGFVTAYNDGASRVAGYSDSSNPPTTKRVGSAQDADGIMMPVRAGDYWKVPASAGGGVVYWLPA